MRELIFLENTFEAKRSLVPGRREDGAVFAKTRTATHFQSKTLLLK